jgi:hypothetical protein
LTYHGVERFLAEYQAAPKAPRTLLAAHWCMSEVSNGGFAQFFFNSTGVLAPEAVVAFRAIGMPNAADTIQAAMNSLGRPYRREREARQDAMTDTDDDRLRQLDMQFFKLLREEAGGFRAAADAYALKHY